MTTYEPTTPNRPRDPFSEAMAAALAAGPTAEEIRVRRERRAAKRRARREAVSRLFAHPLVYTWGDRALWALCVVVVLFTVGVPLAESL